MGKIVLPKGENKYINKFTNEQLDCKFVNCLEGQLLLYMYVAHYSYDFYYFHSIP